MDLRGKIIILAIIIISVILFIGLSSLPGSRINKRDQIVNTCKETDLYDVANRGRIARIYDCTGIHIK